jgi:hypothetical protein
MATDKVLRVEGTRKAASALAGQLATGSVDYDPADLEGKAVEGDSLRMLQALAQELVDADKAVFAAGISLQRAVSAHAEISEVKLPDLMERHQIPKFEFLDKETGRTLIIKLESNKWRVTMPPKKDHEGNEYPGWQEKHDRIFAGLRAIGLGGIIGKIIEVPAGLMSDELVATVCEHIKTLDNTLDPAVIEGVHQARLQSQINALLKDGKKVPEDLDIRPIRKVKATAKK